MLSGNHCINYVIRKSNAHSQLNNSPAFLSSFLYLIVWKNKHKIAIFEFYFIVWYVRKFLNRCLRFFYYIKRFFDSIKVCFLTEERIISLTSISFHLLYGPNNLVLLDQIFFPYNCYFNKSNNYLPTLYLQGETIKEGKDHVPSLWHLFTLTPWSAQSNVWSNNRGVNII